MIIPLIASLFIPHPKPEQIQHIIENRSKELGHVSLQGEQAKVLTDVIVSANYWTRIPHAMILAVVEIESSYKNNAISSANCVGLMQLAKFTAGAMARNVKMPKYNLNKTKDNIVLGTTYLAYLFEEFGRWDYALQAYNMGPAGFRKSNYTVGAYAKKVLTRYDTLQKALTP